MADPFEIINNGMLDMSKAWANYGPLHESRLRDQLYQRKFAEDDAAKARDAATRAAIGSGAKPEDVMKIDPEAGYRYADYVAKNGEQAHKDAQDRAQAVYNVSSQLQKYKAGDPLRRQIYAQAVPYLKSVGVADAELAGFNPDDDKALTSHAAAAKAVMKAGEAYTMHAGDTRLDGNNNVIASVPEAPKWQDFDPTHNYVPTNSAAANFGGAPGSSPTGTPVPSTTGGGDFHSIVAAEGGTNPDGSFRTSPKGAIGPAQLMPGTIPEAAQLAGVDPNLVAHDPRANLAAGQAYYQKQLRDFGDPALAAAAYNAGPGRVRDALQKGGPQGWIQHVPAETQAYVQKVMGGTQGQPAAAPNGYPPGTIMGHPKATEDTVLTPEAIDYYAHSVAAGGDLPTLGQGPRAAMARQDILNRAAQFGAAGGDDGSGRNLSRADLHANALALKDITKQASFIAAAERTALANGQLYLDTSKTAPGQTEFPLLNKGLQWAEGGAGNAEVKAMHGAGETFALEYAKVMSGSATGGGVLSDAAAAHARSLMDEAQTPTQKQHVFAILKQDMRNRGRELAEQQTQLRASIKGGGSQGAGQQGSAPAVAPAVRTATNPKTGEKVQYVNGQWVPLH